ncbi:MAG TPA: hypothetical protein PLZ84_08765, partial [Clostridia bacterium]|nr:hypothetical protein [Clostridia bacterium]
CRFIDVGYGYNGMPIFFEPATLNDTAIYHRNVKIVNNHFHCLSSNIMRAKACSGLVFRNNKLSFTSEYPFVQADNDPITVINCPDAVVEQPQKI